MLVAMAGLPGTGKSTLARALVACLAQRGTPAMILDKDRVRVALFSADDIAYTREQDDLCVDIVLQVAGYLLSVDATRVVILDGRTYSRTYQVRRVTEAAEAMKAEPAFIKCTCSAATALRRIARDQADGGHPAGNRDRDLYCRVAALAQPLAVPHLTVDTEGSLDDSVTACLAYLGLS